MAWAKYNVLQRAVAIQIWPERFLHKCVTLMGVLLTHNARSPTSGPGTGQAGGGEAGLSEPWPSTKRWCQPIRSSLPHPGTSKSEPQPEADTNGMHREMSARRLAPSALISEPMVSCSLKFRKWLLELRLYEDIPFPSFGLTQPNSALMPIPGRTGQLLLVHPLKSSAEPRQPAPPDRPNCTAGRTHLCRKCSLCMAARPAAISQAIRCSSMVCESPLTCSCSLRR